MKTRIAVLGYGNLGRGVEKAVNANPDQELVGVFSRRDPSGVKTVSGVKAYSADELIGMKDDIDVLVICGGSATDLPEMTPKYAEYFNVVDSFDTHANIPVHFENVNPGLFSLARLYSQSVLPSGSDYTFWGRGVSQGHSDAIRRINGVVDARQYTVPVPEAVDRVRNGENPELTTREKHTRECFVVCEDGADKARIEQEIKTMPNYFSDYDTTVNFISQQELDAEHKGLPHGGSVIYSGDTGDKKHVIEFSLKLDSNPEFTGSVLAAVARAAHKMNAEGMKGAKTMFDIAPAYLSPLSGEELRAHSL